MNVLWTPRAASDLEQAVDFIAQDKPDAAIGVASRIYNRIMDLRLTPEIGRIGRLPGTRELVFPPWPYIAIYRVTGETIRILRIRHSSQRHP